MRHSKDMKNFADFGGRYPPLLSASVDNTLLGLQNSSYPTQPHSIIAKYYHIRIPCIGLKLNVVALVAYLLLSIRHAQCMLTCYN